MEATGGEEWKEHWKKEPMTETLSYTVAYPSTPYPPKIPTYLDVRAGRSRSKEWVPASPKSNKSSHRSSNESLAAKKAVSS